MAVKTARTIGDIDPQAEDEGGALRRCHGAEKRRWPSNSPMNSPSPLPGAPAVSVYYQACSGIPLAVGFVGRDRLLWNSMVQGTQRFRQVRAVSCVIPYVLCGGLYCLRC